MLAYLRQTCGRVCRQRLWPSASRARRRPAFKGMPLQTVRLLVRVVFAPTVEDREASVEADVVSEQDPKGVSRECLALTGPWVGRRRVAWPDRCPAPSRGRGRPWQSPKPCSYKNEMAHSMAHGTSSRLTMKPGVSMPTQGRLPRAWGHTLKS